MAAQEPQQQPQIFAPDAFARGGEDKTSTEHSAEQLLAAALEATADRRERVLMVDLDTQRSAEDWTPVIIDTPSTGARVIPAPEEKPNVPLLPPLPPNAG
ncbi:hypothetical protein AB0952_09505 [Streptomyces caniferus]|uniref:hypothetical protein n=1 Tax=Streptomyces TaxID=1883 RepID=UPI003455BAE7